MANGSRLIIVSVNGYFEMIADRQQRPAMTRSLRFGAGNLIEIEFAGPLRSGVAQS
jgi:hypothetical protein